MKTTTIPSIVVWPNPILKEKMPLVLPDAPSLRGLAGKLFAAVDARPGAIGIAAPQIGERASAFVTVLDSRRHSYGVIDGGAVVEEESPADYQRLFFANPHVTPIGDETETVIEGCLSLPGVKRPITRPTAVKVTALDETGTEFTIVATGDLARVIQHEFDHLHGKTIIG